MSVRDIVANVLGCDVLVVKLVLQSHLTHTIGKRTNSPIFPSYR